MKPWYERIRDAVKQLLPQTNYFKRLVWLGCISVSLPILILGTVYYQFSMNKLKLQFQDDSRVALIQLKDRVENAMTSIEYQSMQLAANSSIRSSLGRPGFSDQYVNQLEILDLMTVQKNASNLIKDIVYYGSDSDTALSNSYGKTTLENSPDQINISSAMEMVKSEGWAYLPDFKKDGYITYARQLPVMRMGKPQGVLLFHVGARDVGELLYRSNEKQNSESLIVLDSDNKILLHSSDYNLLGQEANTIPLFNEILARSDREYQFFMEDHSGERVLTAIYRTALGRTYISMLPEHTMADQLNWMRFLIMGSVLGILLFGILLTFLSSKYVYSPIDKLIRYGGQLRHTKSSRIPRSGNEIDYIRSSLTYLNEQTESLTSYVEKIQPDLRDQFILRLLNAKDGIKERTIEAEARSYQLPATGSFVVLIVRPENLFKEKRFLPNEAPIIVFAVKNVMQELLEHEQVSDSFVLGKGEKEIIAVLYFSQAEAADSNVNTSLVSSFADKVCNALYTHLSFTVSVGIGGTRPELHQLSGSYNEAALMLQQQLFDDSRRIFQFNERSIPSEKQAAFNYPKDIEVAITEYLLQGELNLAEQALQRFYEQIRSSESYNTVMHCYHILLSSIIQSLEEMGYGVLDNLGDNLFEQLKARQSYREVHEWFIEFLFPMHRQITEESRANSSKKSVQKVCQYIEANQGMPSLIECAELVNKSPSYLSRMFKQEAGMTFIEYLMKYKVERAKKLLEETEYGIQEIAEMIGYSERNLNRAFQRHVMMSPKQYRMSVR